MVSCELFVADLDVSAAFYVDCLGFEPQGPARDGCARLRSSGWPHSDPRQARPWGVDDFRVVDPDGFYPRITEPLRS